MVMRKGESKSSRILRTFMVEEKSPVRKREEHVVSRALFS